MRRLVVVDRVRFAASLAALFAAGCALTGQRWGYLVALLAGAAGCLWVAVEVES